MAQVKVTTKWKILEVVDRFFDNATATSIGKTVSDEAKRMISEGQSPVRGYGRFEKYANKDSYPGDRKPARPVNLDLTGKMLKGYGHQVSSKKNTVEVGMVRGDNTDKEIAGYHQEGTDKMAQRRMVPGEGEEWAVSIMRSISDTWSKRLADLIRQSNKKE